MRSPIEDEGLSGVAVAGAGKVRLPAPEGGKALERLLLFEVSRGLPEGDARPPFTSSTGNGPAAAGPGPAEALEVTAAVTEWANALASVDVGAAPATLAPERVWRPLGPTVMHNGQTYGSGAGSRVDVSGRIAAIAVDPSDGAHLLVGAAGGGVWESRDRGATWAPRGDHLSTLAVGAICFDPSSPSTVYLGSGEGDAFAGLGQGVYRSDDGGTTWTLLAAAPFVGVGFHRLVVDSADGDILYAATVTGIYTSGDAGRTWTRRRAARCWSVSVHPDGGATEVLAACADGLFRSTDSGATWAAVTLAGLQTPLDRFGRLAVSHARSDGGVAWAWAATAPRVQIPGTTDPKSKQLAPRLWRRATASGGFTGIAVDDTVRTGQAWYDWHVHAAPNSTTVAYVGEVNLFRVERTGRTWSWTNLSSKVGGDSIHPDQHSMAFDPVDGDVVYAGCDGGIYRSPNRGTNWADLNDGLAITEIEYMAHDVGSARWILAGTQDNGSIRYVGRPDWDHVADGDGGDCGSSTTNPDNVYHSYFFMGVERSSNRGNTWTWTPTGSRDKDAYGQLFYPPTEASGAVVAQAGESVFISRDNGVSFTEVALPGRPVASAMHMPSPDRIYVGTTVGRVFRITWSGSSWGTPVELTSPRAAWISDLFVDPADADRIWATSSQLGGGRVFRSLDAGSTWADHSAGLPALPINAVEVHPYAPDRVWLAADKGVYESFDGGATWSSMSVGLPNCIVADLLYHRHAMVLRVGTRNRGVWECEIERLDEPDCGVQWTDSVAANESRRWVTTRWPASWHVVWTVMPTTVSPGAPQLRWDVHVERAEPEFVTYWITVTNLTAQAVSFEGRYAILGYR